MWIVWFPRNKPFYISKPLHTSSAQQALGAWLSAGNHHNNLFQSQEKVRYGGIVYQRDRRKILCDRLLKTDDWDGVKI